MFQFDVAAMAHPNLLRVSFSFTFLLPVSAALITKSHVESDIYEITGNLASIQQNKWKSANWPTVCPNDF